MGTPAKPTVNNELIDVHYDGEYMVSYALRGGWTGTICVRPALGRFIQDSWRAWDKLVDDVRGPIKFDEPSGDGVPPVEAVAPLDAIDTIEKQKEVQNDDAETGI